MKNNRTDYAIKNSFFGVFEKILVTIFPFIIRTIIIKVLGEDYSGLGTLFNSILVFLSFTELGIGSAVVFFMYKPIADSDKDKVNSLLKFYRLLCFLIGTIVLVLGLTLLPFLRFLIKGDTPSDINIYVLYLISLFNSVISYFLFAYQTSIFYASQRNDILSKTAMIVNTMMYMGQIIVIVFLKDYYLYVLLMPIATLILNFIRYKIFKRKYDFRPTGTISKEEKKELWRKVGGLIGFKLSATIIISADNVIISALLGLVVLSRYNNYFYILNVFSGLMVVIFEAVRSSVGNYAVTNDANSNLLIFKKIDFLFSWLIIFISSCFISVYQPFISLWVGEEKVLGYLMVLLFAFEFFVWKKSDVVTMYRDACGLWNNITVIPYLGSIINIGLNLVLTFYFGLPGIVVSTIASFIFMFPFEVRNVFKHFFKNGEKRYYLDYLKYLVIFLTSCGINYLVFYYVSVENLVIRLIVIILFSVLLSNISIIALSLIFFKKEFLFSISLVKKTLFRKRRSSNE